MRKIELLTWEDFPKHAENVKKSLEGIYEVELKVEFSEIQLNDLCPTEEFLEKDKLTLIFVKIVNEGYNVPIITVKQQKDYFILDGHHRSYILTKLMEKTVRAYVLKFPESKNYRAQPRRRLEELPIKDVAPIDNPILRAWAQILTLLKYYELLYNISFKLKRVKVPLSDLIPTQPQILKRQIDSISEILVPILCVKEDNRFYILDGHARSLRAKQLKMSCIKAFILFPEREINFGIAKTAKNLNLASLDDIKIV
ncbi:MAG: ParB N-terminal domain-containing protein [Candidatus Bathyarchaeia archaeon]